MFPFFVTGLIYFLVARTVMIAPLAAVPGYEFAMAMTIPACLGSAVTGIWGRSEKFFSIHWDKRQLPPWVSLLFLNLILLWLPFLLVLVNGLRLGGCGTIRGIGFYILLPSVTACFTTTVAVWCQSKTSNRWRGFGLFLGILFLSTLFTALRTMYGVPLFAFNPFFGFFPGPIYDLALTIEARLIVYRFFVVLLALWWILLYYQSWRPVNRWKNILFYLISLVMVCFFLFENQIGTYTSRDYLRKTLGGEEKGQGFAIYYDRRLLNEGFSPEEFASDVRYWLNDIQRRLGSESPEGIRLYLYHDAKSKKSLMGAGRTLIGDPINREIHMLPTHFPKTILKHELTHVVASQFGIPILKTGRTAGLMEGLAVALEEYFGEYSIHKWAKAILEEFGEKQGGAISPVSMMSNFAFYKHASQKSYLLAGSFVGFLLDFVEVNNQNRREVFKAVYKSADFEKNYGRKLPVLVAEWEHWLAKTELSKIEKQKMMPALVRKGLFERRCPHETAVLREHGYQFVKLQEFGEARECFVESYRLSGGMPEDLYGLLYSLKREEEYQLDSRIFLMALALQRSGRYEHVASRVLGDILVKNGETLAAQKRYEEALEAAFDLESLLILRFLELGMDKEAKAFLETSVLDQRIALVRRLIKQGHGFPVCRIWLGLALLERDGRGEKGDNKIAISNLEMSLAAHLPEEVNQLRFERLGEFYFRRKRWDEAATYFIALGHAPEGRIWRRRLAEEMMQQKHP